MSMIDDYITKRSKQEPEFAKAIQEGSANLEAAVAVRELRDSLKMSQRNFAKLVGKPQSTIARIENGSMNVSVGLLGQIASMFNKKLDITFK
ncbi:helix-turn-helix transcriptional regulator [Companilactobacillus hulinensis]|uniref:helix-turn-helix transcriptional regulator n=1 Tax=Companilactobacillus hulinensis TaxID=2486007 RepID=UPI000F76DD70|nr:helix-turn-helix transcriptional regulator [Companilactobacillus hulinensis]